MERAVLVLAVERVQCRIPTLSFQTLQIPYLPTLADRRSLLDSTWTALTSQVTSSNTRLSSKKQETHLWRASTQTTSPKWKLQGTLLTIIYNGNLKTWYLKSHCKQVVFLQETTTTTSSQTTTKSLLATSFSTSTRTLTTTCPTTQVPLQTVIRSVNLLLPTIATSQNQKEEALPFNL